MAGTAQVLVLTDVAGSTRLWAEHPAVMLAAMARHHRIVHAAIDAHGGHRPVDQGEGDAVFAAFPSAADAVGAVLEFQRALEEEPWPEGMVLRDRVGIHAGEVTEQEGNLFGPEVHRAARIRSLGSGGQVLVSAAVLALLDGRMPPGVQVTDLGTHRLRDFEAAEGLHQLVGPGMPTVFPPLVDPVARDVVLPAPRSSFVGREQEVAELRDLVRANRLVTVVGFGGMGKTRLAIETAAAIAAEDDRLAVRFVDLSAVERASAIGSALAAGLGIDEGIDDPLAAVLRWVRGRRLLLVLDNLEQLLPDGADAVARLLDESAELRVLATSREPLRLSGEQVFDLEPLSTPSEAAALQRTWTAEEAAALQDSAAVRLLVARGAAVRRGFALTPATAQAVAGICRRLDGAPLALELVAVRLRTQSPAALLERLEHALEVAAGGIRDLPARQQTLRATIEWSVRALDPAERTLLWRLAVFPGSFAADAAEAICGGDAVADVSTGLLALVDRSLVRLQPSTDPARPDRFDLLVPIRELAAERLAETDPEGRALDRHADHFAAAARLGAEGTRRDKEALVGLVEQEWPSIRAALDRLHAVGRDAEEVAVSPMLGRALQDLGREGTAVSLLRHAAEHLAPDDAGDAALAVLIHLADFEYGADRAVTAVGTLRRADALLDRNGSPALRVHLAAVDTMMQDPCELGPDALSSTYGLLAGIDERPDALPGWYVAELWTRAAIVAGDPRADAMRDGLLAASEGREHLRLRDELGSALSWIGRPEEAERLLAVFADDDVRRSAYPVDRILPLLVLADIRIAAGRAAEAGPVLDVASRDVAVFDQPFEHAIIEVQRAAVDRVMGDLDSAAAGLVVLLASDAAGEVEGAAAFARWLLAVVERERGRPDAAATSLRLARAVADAGPDDHLKRLCLLESAVQEADATRALALLAEAEATPAPEWVHFAVHYDVDAIRRAFEARQSGA